MVRANRVGSFELILTRGVGMNSYKMLSSLDARSIRSVPAGICLAILLVLGAVPTWAQNAAAGVVSGQVTDQQGAAVPGATVKLTELSTNSITTVSTNEAGRYT